MTDTADDPTQNLTRQPQQPMGMRIPEFVIKQTIGWGLKQIRDTIGKPNNVINTLFAYLPDETRGQITSWLLNHENIWLDVSFHKDAEHLAMIVVEPQSEDEATEDALLGDLLGTAHFSDSEAKQRGVPEKRTTTIYIASNDDRLTLFLYEIVKFILVTNKLRLEEWYDIHNLSLGGQVMAFDDERLPTFAYYRTMSLRYETIFDWSDLEEASKIVSLDLSVDAGGLVTELDDVDP